MLLRRRTLAPGASTGVETTSNQQDFQLVLFLNKGFIKTEHHKYGFRAEYIQSASQVGVVMFLLGAFFLSIGCLSLTDIANYGISTFLGALAYFAFFHC